MCDCFDYFSDDSMGHGFLAHEVDIFAAAIVIDVVKPVRVGESCFVHSKSFCFDVHVVHKFDVIKAYALVVLC